MKSSRLVRPVSAFFVVAACVLSSFSVHAQNYPQRPINVIVPLPAGSATDGVARIVLPAVEKILGQPIVIENIGGAAHLPGMSQASRADADGYHLLFATIADFSANPFLYEKLPYDPAGFDPIGRVSAQSLVMAVPSASGIKTVVQFIEKARNAKLTYASTGIGNTNHLLGEMLMQETGIKLRHIPYQGGSPAVLDLMRGDIDVMFYNLSQFQPGLQTGDLTLIGITSEQRSKFAPDLPTMVEQGYKDVIFTSWYGLFSPKGTPKAAIDTVAAALNKALTDPAIVKALENTDTEVWATSSPAEFSEFLSAERARYGQLINAIGLEKR